MSEKERICSVGIWDGTIPGITFDETGKSSYCHLQENLIKSYPRDAQAMKYWESLVEEMKRNGKGKKYDCIVGVSGGTDSSFLLHIAKQYGLKVLAMNLDNGWNSDIAVKNIKTVTSKLGYDLETYVINYEDVKIVLRAYIKAGLPWIDTTTDMAIKAALYKTAYREQIRFILTGSDFRTEGKQPFEWTYSDFKQFNYLWRRFETKKPVTFPVLSYRKLFFYNYCIKIKLYNPFYFIEYSKQTAQKLLTDQYGWEYYGEHHHENIFTKFIISYWLPVKFGIDKRKITYSAQILNGDISREKALEIISRPGYAEKEIAQEISYFLKKLDLSEDNFKDVFQQPNKFYYDYPNSYDLIFNRILGNFAILKKLLPNKPVSVYLSEITRSTSN